MKALYKLLGKLLGHNLASTPKEVIVDQLNEPRPLPIGMAEFDTWANRIIGGALIKGEPGKEQELIDSQKFTLASMILTLGPTESHKPDAHFIHGLRKAAANQIAHANQQAVHKAMKERLAKEEALKAIGSGGTLSLVKDE